jgi:cell division protein DivIC
MSKKLFRFFTNKFLLTGVAFAVWMIFFDENNWNAQRERRSQLEATEENIAYLTREIAAEEKKHKDLISDPQTLERFAREQYRMKRDNEDVYIVERK